LVDLAELAFTIDVSDLLLNFLVLNPYSLVHIRDLFEVLLPHCGSVLFV